MFRRLLIIKCKILIVLLRLVGKNGSALPGLIIERLDPNFLAGVLKGVEKQLVLVTGTNGKTTTTKMLVTALRSTGGRVVTNSTGSNMTRGLISALVEDMSFFGSLKPTDWFVFEMDEAYAPILTKRISPLMLVALNVLRDQLDRYGEVDTTAQLIAQTAEQCDTFVYSALDPLLTKISIDMAKRGKVIYSFGVASNLLHFVRNEESVHGNKVVQGATMYKLQKLSEQDSGQELVVTTEDGKRVMKIPIKGFHNALNAVAVVASIDGLIVDKVQQSLAVESISQMPVPFGRGEVLRINGKDITVALVKNPAGFTSNLVTFVKNGNPDIILFAVNDRFADGRDVSWLWDVEFKNIVDKKTIVYTSGIRGNDMALRLKHDGITAHSMNDIDKAITTILGTNKKNIVVIPTYTALFEVRTVLAKYGKVPRIW